MEKFSPIVVIGISLIILASLLPLAFGKIFDATSNEILLDQETTYGEDFNDNEMPPSESWYSFNDNGCVDIYTTETGNYNTTTDDCQTSFNFNPSTTGSWTISAEMGFNDPEHGPCDSVLTPTSMNVFFLGFGESSIDDPGFENALMGIKLNVNCNGDGGIFGEDSRQVLETAGYSSGPNPCSSTNVNIPATFVLDWNTETNILTFSNPPLTPGVLEWPCQVDMSGDTDLTPEELDTLNSVQFGGTAFENSGEMYSLVDNLEITVAQDISTQRYPPIISQLLRILPLTVIGLLLFTILKDDGNE